MKVWERKKERKKCIRIGSRCVLDILVFASTIRSYVVQSILPACSHNTTRSKSKEQTSTNYKKDSQSFFFTILPFFTVVRFECVYFQLENLLILSLSLHPSSLSHFILLPNPPPHYINVNRWFLYMKDEINRIEKLAPEESDRRRRKKNQIKNFKFYSSMRRRCEVNGDGAEEILIWFLFWHSSEQQFQSPIPFCLLPCFFSLPVTLCSSFKYLSVIRW